jgi:hypothetical protein
LSFTVHSVPAPDVATQRRRVVTGRWRMLLLLLACAAPVIASYFTYYVIRPDGRTNYSALILPTRTLPAALDLRTLDGQPVAPASLRGQWLMVVTGDAACDAACEERIYLQRQLRDMLGRERDRVDRVWLVTGSGVPSDKLIQAASAKSPLTVLRVDRAALAAWLAPAEGQALEDHVYVVDPMGEWMLRAPVKPEPSRLKRDLEKLLRASSSWDRAGR